MSEANPGSSRKFLHSRDVSDILKEEGYSVGVKFARGKYSNIYKIKNRETGKYYATKVIDKTSASKSYVEKFLPREIDIVKTLNHPNIIKTHRVVTSDIFVCIIMDLADGGSLKKMLKSNGPISDSDAKLMFGQLADAMEYLHTKDIVHRDLKPANIVFQLNGDLILCDFGFATTIINNSPECTYCGSRSYSSPTLLGNKPYDAKKNDIWGLGCVLYEMVCGFRAFGRIFKGDPFPRHLSAHLSFPATISEECKDLVRKMVHRSESHRADISQVLHSPWLESRQQD